MKHMPLISPWIHLGLVAPFKANVTDTRIIECVCDYYTVPFSCLKKEYRCREPQYIMARYMIWYIMRKLNNRSYHYCAKIMGGFNHSTVVHAYRLYKGYVEVDAKVKSDYISVMELI